jgi:hypothetical protein
MVSKLRGHNYLVTQRHDPITMETSIVPLRKLSTFSFTFHVIGRHKDTRTLKRNLHDCPVVLTPSICRAIKLVCEGFFLSPSNKAIRHPGSVVLDHRSERLLTSGQWAHSSSLYLMVSNCLPSVQTSLSASRSTSFCSFIYAIDFLSFTYRTSFSV